MELIAASRIIKAQQRAQAAAPYSRELTRAVSAVATFSNVDHPLTTEKEDPPAGGDGGDHLRPRPGRGLLLVGDQGGQAAAGAAAAHGLRGPAVSGRPQGDRVREVPPAARSPASGRGSPTRRRYAHAREIADAVIEAFLTPTEEGGVDEIHIVYTRFVSMLTQTARGDPDAAAGGGGGHRAAEDTELLPLYEFEPDAETVLDELLPLYVASRIQYCLLQSAASELASRQRAMKAATDNAQQLIERLTREANQARQAEITQEISEIVGGAAALAEATASRQNDDHTKMRTR